MTPQTSENSWGRSYFGWKQFAKFRSQRRRSETKVFMLKCVLIQNKILNKLSWGPSSETQWQLVGAGKSLNGWGKNSGQEKSSRRVRAPGDKVLTDQFQTGRSSSGFWLVPENLCFFLLNHRAVTLGVISCFPTWNIHTCQLLAISWLRVYSRRKVLNTAQDVGEIRKKLAGNTLDLSQVS